MKPLQLAYLNLIRHKTQTIISVLAIGLSVATGGVLYRLHELTQQRLDKMVKGVDAIVAAKAGSLDILFGALNFEGEFPGYMPGVLFESLRADQEVHFEDGATAKPSTIQNVIPVVWFAKWKSYKAMGTDESIQKSFSDGEKLELQEGHWFSDISDVVIGSDVARSAHLGDTLTLNSWTGSPTQAQVIVRVAGILRSTNQAWDRVILGSRQLAVQVNTQTHAGSIWGPNVLNYFVIILKPNGEEPLRDLINKRTVGQVLFVPEEMKKVRELVGSGDSLGFMISILILLLGALVVFGMTWTRFEAIRRQLAILRALGYTIAEIILWSLTEGVMVALMSIFLGAAIDFFVFDWVRWLMGSALPSIDIVNISIFASYPVWFGALIACVLGAWLPTQRLSSVSIHDALKGM